MARFHAAHHGELAVLKPEEQAGPQVAYRGMVPELAKKVPKGRNHDPRSYEIETWAELRAEFPSPSKRS